MKHLLRITLVTGFFWIILDWPGAIFGFVMVTIATATAKE